LSVKVVLPTALARHTDGQKSFDSEAENLPGLLLEFDTKFPALAQNVKDENGKLRRFVNVYVNDEDMRYLQKEATALKDGDTISIVPSIAGGCCPGVTDSSGVRALVIIGFECHGWSRTLPRPPAEIDSIQ
jgi:molybdopterin converting factor small subunit